MSRLARVAIALAARRWPARMRDEWLAEMALLPAREQMSFAGSLLLASARMRGGTVALAGGVTLLAAALANAVHATNPLMIVAAAGVMALAGLRLHLHPRTAAAVLGPGLFAFLLAGNEVAVMPFMGIADVAPAVVVWTVGILLTVRAAGTLSYLAAAGTMAAATAAGSWHAAAVLGVSPLTAPLWFPLTLAPRSAAPAEVPAVLLGNAATMTAPMLLCTVFVLALAGTHALPSPARSLRPTRWRWAAAAAAAPATVLICGATTSAGTTPSATMDQLLAQSAVFGFGFTTTPAGATAAALMAAILAAHLTEPAT